MKKRTIFTLGVLFLSIIILTLLIINKKNNRNLVIQNNPINYEENKEDESDEDKEIIKEIAEDKGININNSYNENTSLYEVKKEYDGREYITVKDSIKFKVALAGIIKKQKPELNKLDEELKKAPKHTGIWIEESSRNEFLKIINEITNANYSIDEDGFLRQEESFIMNNYDKKINNILLKNELFVFAINSECYILDEVTGEITLYPFEEMDPHQGAEIFESNDKYIYVISQNKKGKTNIKETIENIIKSF